MNPNAPEPTSKRQLSGLKTPKLEAKMMPVQIEAITEALKLVEQTVNELLLNNLAGETGVAGLPCRIFPKLDPDEGVIAVVMERITLTDNPSIVPATESDVPKIIEATR